MKPRIFSSSVLRGFTLLEMLVVLLIVSFIFTLLMGALRQVLSMQERLESLGGPDLEQAMAIEWLREVVEGLQPDERMGPNAFRGDPHQFSSLSTGAISENRRGAPTPVTLRIETDRIKNESVLNYDDGATKLVLLRQPVDDMRFFYGEDDQELRDAWPPSGMDAPQIPRLIIVEWGRGKEAGGQLALVPQGPSLPLPNAARIFGAPGNSGPMPSGGAPATIGPNPYGLR